MTKIAFIGAGSLGFTEGLVRDVLTFPLLEDAHIALMDIDAERLDFAYRKVSKIIAAGKYPARVTATLDRAFGTLQADRMVTGTAAVNHASRLLERLGFRKTGEKTESFKTGEDGKPV